MRRLTTAALALGLALVLGAAAPAQPQQQQPTTIPAAMVDDTVYLIDGYLPRFSLKKAMNKRYAPTFDKIQKTILERQARGETLTCSTQILTELAWLIQYTNETARVDKRLEDLRRSLKLPPERQRAALLQSPDDGSWGGCYEEWFLRVYASADPLKQLAVQGARPAYPLKFLERVDSGEKLAAYARSLLVSDVGRNGRNQRKEMNLGLSALSQMLFLPELAYLFEPSWQRDRVAQGLKDFMDHEWQDPETGYWGPWYKIDGKLVKTEDLSITFHIASYRNGDIPRIREMVRTTLRIRDRPYPFGWHDRGTQNNHHAYDVVRLLRLGWPHMTDEERANAWAEILIITARARRLSMNSIGEFDVSPYSSLDEAYYFGVSLFDELGYFRASKRFWTFLPSWQPEDSEELRQKILDNIEHLGIRTPMMEAAKRKLIASD
ncbi:hypothetical protein FHP25_36115 [Vineibacter terrae]|uniref:Uncharacterized protein n=1 Tax=Vineibacter terrae TaxID=2586908 RepID=A0A5C8P9E6_9HYPH|nr:hypothetical protein [Vineibacter terrae]TXL70149.1 hypothetical protein FHP25_36115 [Vineibacter terrae]